VISFQNATSRSHRALPLGAALVGERRTLTFVIDLRPLPESIAIGQHGPSSSEPPKRGPRDAERGVAISRWAPPARLCLRIGCGTPLLWRSSPDRHRSATSCGY